MPTQRPIGIMAAMTEEIDLLVAEMQGRRVSRAGMREYHQGKLWGKPAVAVFSRWGKVAAAATAEHLITKYGVREIVFTGVAGGVHRGLRVGDVVVGTKLWQHDLDARPLFGQHVIPLLGESSLSTGFKQRGRLLKGARAFVKSAEFPRKQLREFGNDRPRVVLGEIATGDQFFADHGKLKELSRRLPKAVCVEMEGASVAQVCHEHGVPFSILRVISDSADEGAPADFPKFVRAVASHYSRGVLKSYLR